MKRLLILCMSVVCGLSAYAETKTTRIDKNLTIYTDVMRQLDMNYVDTLNYDDLIEVSINQMLRRVDPYTVYIPKREDESLRMMTTGKYGGIGAMIMQRDTAVYVSEPYESNPAQQAGLRAGTGSLLWMVWIVPARIPNRYQRNCAVKRVPHCLSR